MLFPILSTMLPPGLWVLAIFTPLLASAKTTCKCLPGNPCFPDAATWSRFSATLSSPLTIDQRPLAAACYSNTTDFNPVACAQVTALQNSALFRASVSNAAQFQNVEALVINNTVQDCSFDVTSGSVCFQGRIPPFSVNVSTVSDIQNTIRFASQHNLKLVIKNAGHEFLGRQLGVGALELFTHNLKNITFSHSFVPANAPHDTTGQPAVTIGAGVEWGELYEAVDNHNQSIPGGFSPGGTVGAAGGWILGGGHSVLSPFYGLGVDNVLELKVVLPNASCVTVNRFQHPDLFFALRGGGGPSFGVLVSLTYKTHPRDPITTAFYTAAADSPDSYRALLKLFVDQHNDIADAGWSGVWPFFDNSLALTFFARGAPSFGSTANTTLEKFFNTSKAIPGVNITLAITVAYPSFQAYIRDNLDFDSTNGLGFNFTVKLPGTPRLAISSWLLPRNLTTSAHSDALADAFAKMSLGTGFLVGGGVVADVDPDDAAVTPAWRRTITDMTITPPWNDSATFQENYQATFDQNQPLRELAPIPIGGQYYNEPDTLEVNWQGAFWGRHYPRLLQIKKEIDPHDLLIVHKGVNSEQWDEEIICKTT